MQLTLDTRTIPEQIADNIEVVIKQGSHNGYLLPSHRVLAERIKKDHSIVSRTYSILCERKLAINIPLVGMFVWDRQGSEIDSEVLPFTISTTAPVLQIDFDLLPYEYLTQQIVRQIEAQIRRGILPNGTRLPTARDLAKQLDISFPTVQSVYKILADKNLTFIKLGTGIFVWFRQDISQRATEVSLRLAFEEFLRQAYELGLTVEDIYRYCQSHTKSGI